MGMLTAISPKATQEVKNELGKYSQDKNGLMQAIAAHGGMSMVDKGIAFAKRSPKISNALRMANIDLDAIRRDLQDSPASINSTTNINMQSQSNSYKDRLNKIK